MYATFPEDAIQDVSQLTNAGPSPTLMQSLTGITDVALEGEPTRKLLRAAQQGGMVGQTLHTLAPLGSLLPLPNMLLNPVIENQSDNELFKGGERLDEESWKTSPYQVPGLSFNSIKGSDGVVSEYTAKQAAETQERINLHSEMLSNPSISPLTKWIGQNITPFVADPIDATSAYLAPEVIGGIGIAARLESMAAEHAIMAHKIVGHAVTGTLEGGLMMAPEGSAEFLDGTDLGTNALAALHDIGMGGLFVGAIHTGVGGFKHIRKNRTKAKLKEFYKHSEDVEDRGLSETYLNREKVKESQVTAFSQAINDQKVEVGDILKDGINEHQIDKGERAPQVPEGISAKGAFDDIHSDLRSILEEHAGKTLDQKKLEQLLEQHEDKLRHKRLLDDYKISDLHAKRAHEEFKGLSKVKGEASDNLLEKLSQKNSNSLAEISDQLTKHHLSAKAESEMRRLEAVEEGNETHENYMQDLPKRIKPLLADIDHAHPDQPYHLKGMDDLESSTLSAPSNYKDLLAHRFWQKPKESIASYDGPMHTEFENALKGAPESLDKELEAAKEEAEEVLGDENIPEEDKVSLREAEETQESVEALEKSFKTLKECLIGEL